MMFRKQRKTNAETDRNSEAECCSKKQKRPPPTYQNPPPVATSTVFAPLRDLPMENETGSERNLEKREIRQM
jgi:hypothetical protein